MPSGAFALHGQAIVGLVGRVKGACPGSTSRHQLQVDSTTTPASSSRQGSKDATILDMSFGSRSFAATRSRSSVTVTTLLFGCRSIPLCFLPGFR